MRRTVTSVLGTVAVAAGLLVVPAAPSGAAGSALSLPGFTDLAVDEAHDRVLITSGAASSDVTVLGLDGTARAPIGGLAGAEDIHVSADGASYYVSLRGQKAIGVVSADTLAVDRIVLGAEVCPTSLAQEGAALWFTYTDCASSSGMLGSLRLADSTVTLGLQPEGVSPDHVEASPGLTGRVVVKAGNGLTLLDVSGGPTSAAVEGASVTVDARAFAVTPDGAEVVATDYGPYRHVGFSTTDLTERTVYPSVAYPNAVAVRADGLVAAGSNGIYDQDVFLYRQGSSSLYRSYETGDSNNWLAQGGLAFGARDLYAVTESIGGAGGYAYRRITPRQATSLTIARAASTYAYGATAKVTVHVSRPGATVSVHATPYKGTKKLVRTAATDARGNLTVTLPVSVRTTFTATYAGDADRDPAAASTTVYVRARVSATATKVVGRSGAYRLVRSGTKPRVVGTVAPSHAGGCVRFQGQEPSGSGWGHTQTSPCLRLDRASSSYVWFDATWKPKDRVRIRVLWDGDTRNAAAGSSWVYLKFVR